MSSSLVVCSGIVLTNAKLTCLAVKGSCPFKLNALNPEASAEGPSWRLS